MRGWRVGNRVEDVIVANVAEVSDVTEATNASVEETTNARLNGGVSESGVASVAAAQVEPIRAQSHAADALVFWPDRMELPSDYKTDPMVPGRGIRNANG